MPPMIENFNKLSQENREYCTYLQELAHHITFVAQERQDGFGHAVACAREWANNEPFLLMLGDHLYASNTDTPCARQLLDTYEQINESVVGLKITDERDIHNFGCVTGVWSEPNAILSVTEFAEKPDIDYAREHLHIEEMERNEYCTVFGQYVLQTEIFLYLEEHITHNIREGGEFQLTSCLDQLRQENGFSGYIVNGKRFDIGIPEAYRQTVIDFRNA
jgi:UTP--glucose-1-phosphate uridylyltransferase